jgi:hypothetical protein
MLDVALTLHYLTQVVTPGPVYQYSGSVTQNTQTQYNNITWNDVRPKPTWQTIIDYSEAAWTYYNPPPPYTLAQATTLINQLLENVSDLQEALGDKADAPIVISAVAGLPAVLDNLQAQIDGNNA